MQLSSSAVKYRVRLMSHCVALRAFVSLLRVLYKKGERCWLVPAPAVVSLGKQHVSASENCLNLGTGDGSRQKKPRRWAGFVRAYCCGK